MTWTLAAGPWSGPPQYELSEHKSWKASVKLTESATMSVDIDGRAEQAANVVELVDDLWLFRDGARVLRCRVGSTNDDIGDEHGLTFSAADYRELLVRRLRWDDWTLRHLDMDAATHLWTLLAQTQAEPGGQLGVTRGITGGVEPYVYADLKTNAGETISDEADKLAKMSPGFEWEIDADLKYNVWHRGRGRPTGEVLEHGAAVAKVQRQLDPSRYANAVRQSGKAEEDTTPAVPGVRLEVPNIASLPEGRWDVQSDITGLSSAAAVAATAQGQLDEYSQITPSYSVTLRRGFWRGPDHLWVGDIVPLKVRSGRLNVLVDLPIVAVELAGAGEDEPGVVLTLGAYTFKQRRDHQLRRFDRRLATLEQR